jgi:hypothetical protein
MKLLCVFWREASQFRKFTQIDVNSSCLLRFPDSAQGFLVGFCVKWPFYPNRDVSGVSNIKILVTVAYGEGCVRPEEFVAEDLGEEDVVGWF